MRVWGDVTGGRRPLDGPPGRGSDVYGIYWDEPTQRLLWSYGDGYNTVSGADPSLGASVLDEATGVATPIGNWRFDRSCKMTMGGVCAVPDWFAAAHCPGQRLAAGFGGYFSIVAVGPASMGPAVAAFDPAAIAPILGVGSITARPLVGYPFNATPYTTPDRCHRDTDYTNEFDSWNPRGGVGYWSWTDQMAQGGVWVDTPAVTGMLFCPNLGNGRTWYETSTLHAERASHAWMVYDPGDLAAVAAGTTPQWAIQPARSWSVRYPGLTYPQPGWSDGPQHPVTGVCFDTVEHMVYVAVQWPWSPGAPASGTLVSAYEIAVV